MPVVNHSHTRKKWLAIGCRSSPRWVWQRCRKIVTEAIVTCVNSSAATMVCHQFRLSKPPSMNSKKYMPTPSPAAPSSGATGHFVMHLNGALPRSLHQPRFYSVILHGSDATQDPKCRHFRLVSWPL